MKTTLGGIVQPLFAYKFRLDIAGLDSDLDHHILTNTVDVHVDLLNKVIAAKIRASIDPHSFDAVKLAISNNLTPIIGLIHGEEPIFSLHFQQTNIIKHDLHLSYEAGGVLVHDIQWSFQRMSLSKP